LRGHSGKDFQALSLEEFLGVERKPILRSAASKEIFGEVGPVIRSISIAVNKRDRASVTFAAQHFGARIPRRTRANDQN
jgi:hypothetical protein